MPRLAAPFLLCLFAAGVLAQRGASELERAQALIDQEEPQQAIEILDAYLRKHQKSAAGHLSRSTAHFVLGDLDAGRRDLERALELDPSLRQGWLNLGGLHLAEDDPSGALAAFERARDLDPAAADNDLNLGTVKLLLGRSREAAIHFEAHLGRQSEPAAAAFLIAKNYAVAGYHDEALGSLRDAIQNDERFRMEARTDPVFDPLRTHPDFVRLLETDTFEPEPGAHVRRAQIDAPYEIGRGEALAAVVDSLRALGMPFDSRIEVTPSWSIIHGDMRIKLTAAGPEKSTIELTAPAERFTEAQWEAESERLLLRIRWELAPKIPG